MVRMHVYVQSRARAALQQAGADGTIMEPFRIIPSNLSLQGLQPHTNLQLELLQRFVCPVLSFDMALFIVFRIKLILMEYFANRAIIKS